MFALQLTQPVNHPATGASPVNKDRNRPLLLCNLRNLGRDLRRALVLAAGLSGLPARNQTRISSD